MGGSHHLLQPSGAGRGRAAGQLSSGKQQRCKHSRITHPSADSPAHRQTQPVANLLTFSGSPAFLAISFTIRPTRTRASCLADSCAGTGGSEASAVWAPKSAHKAPAMAAAPPTARPSSSAAGCCPPAGTPPLALRGAVPPSRCCCILPEGRWCRCQLGRQRQRPPGGPRAALRVLHARLCFPAA